MINRVHDSAEPTLLFGLSALCLSGINSWGENFTIVVVCVSMALLTLAIGWKSRAQLRKMPLRIFALLRLPVRGLDGGVVDTQAEADESQITRPGA